MPEYRIFFYLHDTYRYILDDSYNIIICSYILIFTHTNLGFYNIRWWTVVVLCHDNFRGRIHQLLLPTTERREHSVIPSGFGQLLGSFNWRQDLKLFVCRWSWNRTWASLAGCAWAAAAPRRPTWPHSLLRRCSTWPRGCLPIRPTPYLTRYIRLLLFLTTLTAVRSFPLRTLGMCPGSRRDWPF